MEPEKKVQAEDQPVVEVIEKKADAGAVAETTKKGLVDRALPWVITGLVCFLVGALLTYFLIYQPKANALKTAQADLAAATEKASQLQTELNTAQSDLSSAQATIEEQAQNLLDSAKYGLIYKFQADVNAARTSLAMHEPTSARQALGYASDDLTELEKAGLDADTLNGFKEKIESANGDLVTSPDDALDTLKTLHEDLLYLITNTK